MSHIDGSIFDDFIDMLFDGNPFDPNDVVHPGAGDDIVFGWDGDDYIDDLIDDAGQGSGGNDEFYGEAGNDTLYGWTGNDTLDGGTGDDDLYGESGNDSLDGWTGNDYMSGGSGNDTLLGFSGNDTLYGSTGNDVLNGEGDNDFIVGGAGRDTLTGGSGDDTFDFNSTSKSVGFGRDLITSFEFSTSSDPMDKIDLTTIDAKASFWVPGNQAFSTIEGTGIGQLSFVDLSNGNTLIKGNTDFDSFSELQIEVADGTTSASFWDPSLDFFL